MLEKIELPTKPSLRGSNWVVDASHCQGCSSQFTFINRKHHCRRCGGIFCNSCTQQRMMLRGQGDSPVRICDPCKKLEEAARFELRYGKNRAGRGTSKPTSADENEVLNRILETNAGASVGERSSGLSSSTTQEDVEGLAIRNVSLNQTNNINDEAGSATPEEIRQQALDERNKYKVLKGEGRSAEALGAFKRAKELERQAAALELQLRKNRRKASVSSSNEEILKNEDANQESDRRGKQPTGKGKEKDDLTAELKALGWSDMDLNDVDKKPSTTTVESELSNLTGGNSGKVNSGQAAHGIDRTEVVALKKKALTLKREGKLAEAKEELKKAKILEKQLEEEEMLAEAGDSDDEITALIRSLDNDKEDELPVEYDMGSTLGLNNLVDLDIDDFEVTDDDFDDPEIGAALKSLGWTEESNQPPKPVAQSVSLNKESLANEVLNLKKEALNQKRSGNVAEAMSLLRKAKLLEKDLGNSISHLPDDAEMVPEEKEMDGRSTKVMVNMGSNLAPKNRLMIQKELLALKKKALALRREGKIDEAEEELKKGRVLEKQFEEIDNAAQTKVSRVNAGHEFPELASNHLDESVSLGSIDERDGDVTDQDMHDPAYLAVLSSLGWQDEDGEQRSSSPEVSQQNAASSIEATGTSHARLQEPRRGKTEIQRELLVLKRKALALRRQGQTAEAEELLEKAKALEAQMADLESLAIGAPVAVSKAKAEVQFEADEAPVDNGMLTKNETREPSPGNLNQLPRSKAEIQRELLGLKRKALAMRRNGQVNEAEELLERAKVLETQMVELEAPATGIQVGISEPKEIQTADRPTQRAAEAEGGAAIGEAAENTKMDEPRVNPTVTTSNGNSLQSEILGHKRKAVALKREGKLAEAREELRKAKLLERGLEDRSNDLASSTTRVDIPTSSAAPAKTHEEVGTVDAAPVRPLSSHDRFKLQQECLAHKRNAMKLRREGRAEEAEAEHQVAKSLETQLEERAAPDAVKSSSTESRVLDDAGVEDLLDPQLLSALKAIGIQDTPDPSRKQMKEEPPVSHSQKSDSCGEERAELEAQIKAEKVKALKLKRSGKQAEALDALRRAKQLEKKLDLLSSPQ